MADNDDVNLAWCAGFFDGEGHVSYKRSYPSKVSGKVSPMLMCSVPQNSDNKEVLEFFQSVVGFGTIKGPYKSTTATQHRLIFRTTEVIKLLSLLKPYLKSKKTLDFQRALVQYWTHDPTPTVDDHTRDIKHDLKRMKKNTDE